MHDAGDALYDDTYYVLDLMNQWFAPTRLSITFERAGPGKFTEEEIKHIVERDASGRVVALRLPSKTVVIANHQVRHHPDRVASADSLSGLL